MDLLGDAGGVFSAMMILGMVLNKLIVYNEEPQ